MQYLHKQHTRAPYIYIYICIYVYIYILYHTQDWSYLCAYFHNLRLRCVVVLLSWSMCAHKACWHTHRMLARTHKALWHTHTFNVHIHWYSSTLNNAGECCDTKAVPDSHQVCRIQREVVGSCSRYIWKYAYVCMYVYMYMYMYMYIHIYIFDI